MSNTILFTGSTWTFFTWILRPDKIIRWNAKAGWMLYAKGLKKKQDIHQTCLTSIWLAFKHRLLVISKKAHISFYKLIVTDISPHLLLLCMFLRLSCRVSLVPYIHMCLPLILNAYVIRSYLIWQATYLKG